MAVIMCPECGGKISDKVKQCVHCGVNITFCLECGKVYTEDISLCKECGYKIKSENSQHSAEDNTFKNNTAKNVISKWELGNKSQKIFSSNYLWIALNAAAVVFLAIAVIKLLTWNDVLSANETLSGIKTLLILAAVFYVAHCLVSTLVEYNKIINISAWCIGNKINLESVINNTLQLDYDVLTMEDAGAELGGVQWCIRAAIYAKDAIFRADIKKKNAIKICLNIVVSVLLYIFLAANAKVYMQAEMWRSDSLGIGGFEIGMIDNWWILIAAAVVYVIFYILSKHIDKLDDKACMVYVEKNHKDYLNIYKKYATSDGFAEYLFKRVEKIDN